MLIKSACTHWMPLNFCECNASYTLVNLICIYLAIDCKYLWLRRTLGSSISKPIIWCELLAWCCYNYFQLLQHANQGESVNYMERVSNIWFITVYTLILHLTQVGAATAFSITASLGKAVARAKRALPGSSTKTSHVVARIAKRLTPTKRKLVGDAVQDRPAWWSTRGLMFLLQNKYEK